MKSLRKAHLLAIQVPVLLYLKQLQRKMELFDLVIMKVHQGMMAVSNPTRKYTDIILLARYILSYSAHKSKKMSSYKI